MPLRCSQRLLLLQGLVAGSTALAGSIQNLWDMAPRRLIATMCPIILAAHCQPKMGPVIRMGRLVDDGSWYHLSQFLTVSGWSELATARTAIVPSTVFGACLQQYSSRMSSSAMGGEKTDSLITRSAFFELGRRA
ncbi:hypothetical protein NDU88_004818 [Pleurodeles waltl]|uniref:Secreted protein n=1 Tax=Pleurodeles waltl TaxID=8319 RepID=A0AAV7TSA6_PLEWA|nr:hypothetical protein NDU88_004818 [Pleurodeles waltl]